MAWLAAIAGGVAQGAGSYYAGKEQSEAAAEAQKNEQDFIANQQRGAQSWAQQAAGGYIQNGNYKTGPSVAESDLYQQMMTGLGYGASNAREALQSGETDARHYLSGAANEARNIYGQAVQSGAGAITGSTGAAAGALGSSLALQGYGSSAATPISAYDVTGRPSSIEAMMGGTRALSERLGSPLDLENDQGYQFRLKQGEQAINRQAAAQGGRGGGATMKALADYNQGMASQEYAAADQRRRSDVQQLSGLLGQEAGFANASDQYRQAALFNQAGRSDAAGLSAKANQLGLAGMGYGAAGQLAGIYGESGKSLADLFQGSARDLSSIQASLAGQQAQSALSTASQQSGLEQSLASQNASNLFNVQNAYANSLLGVGNQMVGLASGANFYGGVPYAGAGAAGIANAAGQTGQNLALLYSMQNDNNGGKG